MKKNPIEIIRFKYNSFKRTPLKYYYIQREASRLARLLWIIGILYFLVIFVLLPYQYYIAFQDYYIETNQTYDPDNDSTKFKIKLYSLAKEFSHDSENNNELIYLIPAVNILFPHLDNFKAIVSSPSKVKKVVLYDEDFNKNFNSIARVDWVFITIITLVWLLLNAVSSWANGNMLRLLSSISNEMYLKRGIENSSNKESHNIENTFEAVAKVMVNRKPMIQKVITDFFIGLTITLVIRLLFGL